MVMSNREQILFETQRTRAQAAEMLRELLGAKSACEATLAAENRSDMVKHVTGQSSLEVAIAETRKLIDSLDRALAEAARDLDTDDRDVLGAADGLEAVITAGRLALRGRMVGSKGCMARVG
jgi:hypothetical protein